MNMQTQIREALARGYCSSENEQKVVDPVLMEAMMRELMKLFTPVRYDDESMSSDCLFSPGDI